MGIEARRRSLDRVESDPLSILLGVGGEVGSSCEQTREKKKGRTGDGCRREVSSHRDRLESLASSIAFFK